MLHGPFGKCVDFENIGETRHDTHARQKAEELGIVRLTSTLSLFPSLIRGSDGPEGFRVPADRKHVGGQILLASNFHWFAAPGYWNGGLIHHADNAKLLLNFAASACKAPLG